MQKKMINSRRYVAIHVNRKITENTRALIIIAVSSTEFPGHGAECTFHIDVRNPRYR